MVVIYLLCAVNIDGRHRQLQIQHLVTETIKINAGPDIGVTLSNHVATVELQRPPLNFFDHSLISQIADPFDALGANADCRAIVLASTGKAFCAGANFGSGQEDGSGSDDFTE